MGAGFPFAFCHRDHSGEWRWPSHSTIDNTASVPAGFGTRFDASPADAAVVHARIEEALPCAGHWTVVRPGPGA